MIYQGQMLPLEIDETERRKNDRLAHHYPLHGTGRMRNDETGEHINPDAAMTMRTNDSTVIRRHFSMATMLHITPASRPQLRDIDKALRPVVITHHSSISIFLEIGRRTPYRAHTR